MKHTIDATNKKIGRVASEAAKYLMGKQQTDYSRNTVSHVEVEVINTSRADINHKKLLETVHPRYSGYPSGIIVQTVDSLIAKKGYREVFKKAIYGMLPSNKLRNKMMKNLKITE